jgi:hypothetical protein
MEDPEMSKSHRRRYAVPLAGALAGLAAVLVTIGVASGEPGNGTPEIQVLPSPTGLSYGQTVEVKADDLPKGSGTAAVTICGLQDEGGATIAAPGADDCAGQAELGTLVKLQENKDGTFDQQYTLPQSGQRFGKNSRFCDASHHCAVVVADANPSAPAYHVDQVIQFVDQSPFGTTPDTEATTTTTAPPPPSAHASTGEMRVGDSVDIDGEHWDANDSDTAVGFVDENDHATSPPVVASVDGNGTLHVTLTAVFDDMDATGILVQDPSGGSEHAIRLPIVVHPQPGVSSKQSSETQFDPSNPQGAHVRLRARIVGTPPGSSGAPLPEEVAGPVRDGCSQLAGELAGSGADPNAIVLVCHSLTDGGGGDQLQLLLHNPTVLCIALAPAANNDPQFTAACNQALGGAAAASGPLGDGAKPLTDALP